MARQNRVTASPPLHEGNAPAGAPVYGDVGGPVGALHATIQARLLAAGIATPDEPAIERMMPTLSKITGIAALIFGYVVAAHWLFAS